MQKYLLFPIHWIQTLCVCGFSLLCTHTYPHIHVFLKARFKTMNHTQQKGKRNLGIIAVE